MQNSEIVLVETSNINENAARISFLSLVSLCRMPPGALKMLRIDFER
jgi:hypothetical protein